MHLSYGFEYTINTENNIVQYVALLSIQLPTSMMFRKCDDVYYMLQYVIARLVISEFIEKSI